MSNLVNIFETLLYVRIKIYNYKDIELKYISKNKLIFNYIETYFSLINTIQMPLKNTLV